jgi:DNA-binding NarL/FixJ family response regulator
MLTQTNSSLGIGVSPDVSRDCEFEWLLCLASKWQASTIPPASESEKSQKPSRSENGSAAVRPLVNLGKSDSNVLIVSSRTEHLRVLIRVLDATPASAGVFTAFSWRQAQHTLSRRSVAVVLCDDSLPDGSYRDVMLSVRAGQKRPNFVVLLRWGEWSERADAFELGAFDVLRYPFEAGEVERAVQLALENYAARQAAARNAKISLNSAPAALHAKIAAGLTHDALDKVFERETQMMRGSLMAVAPILPPKPDAANRPAKKPTRRSA